MKNSNYFMVMNSLIDDGDTQALSHLEFRVLMSLLRYSNSGKDTCYPSFSTLAAKCCASEKGVRLAVKVLEDKGFIAKLSQGSNLKGLSNVYKVAPLGVPFTAPIKLRTVTKLADEVNPEAEPEKEETVDILTVEVEEIPTETTQVELSATKLMAEPNQPLTIEYVYELGTKLSGSHNMHFGNIARFERYLNKQAVHSSLEQALTDYYYKLVS